MNHLLSTTAFAAALAIAAPVWAQAPMNPYPSGAPSTTQAAPYAQQSPARPPAASNALPAPEPMQGRHAARRAHRGRYAGHMRGMRHMRHVPLAGRGSSAPSDNVANQLNRQELSNLSGSSTPSAGYAPQGYPPLQGYPPPQGYAPQGYPPQGEPPRY